MGKLRFVLLIAVTQVMAAGSNPAPAPPQIDEIVKIDVHSHILEPVPEFVDMMRRINLRIINICVRGTIPQWLPRAEQLVEDAHRNFPISLPLPRPLTSPAVLRRTTTTR